MKDVAAALGLEAQRAGQQGVEESLVLSALTRADEARKELDHLQDVGLLILRLGTTRHAGADEDAEWPSQVVLVDKRRALGVHRELLEEHRQCAREVGPGVRVFAEMSPRLLVVLDVEDAPVLPIAIPVEPLVGVVDDNALRVLPADVGILHRCLREGCGVLEAEALRRQFLSKATPLAVGLGAAAVTFVDEDQVVAFEERRADGVGPGLGFELRDLDDVDVRLLKREAKLWTLLEHAPTQTGMLHLSYVLATKPSVRRDQQHVVRCR